jgi:hypothetical protein
MRRRSDFRRAVSELVADVSGLDVELDQLLDAIDQACGVGYPPSTIGSGIRSGGGVSSIVERQAFGRDEARADARRLAELVMWCHGAMAEVDGIRRRYTVAPRKGRTTRRGHADDGCEMMASIGEYEPGRLTDVNRTLPHKRRLGRWAADFVARTGRLPVREEIERHARGGRVRTG